MRKWRPSFICKYVISECRGNANSLEIILNRILPLRKFENQQDIIIFLGGYIDGDEFGHEVLDALISIQKEYPERSIFLRGDHEEMMLRAINGNEKDYSYWLNNGGQSTVTGYIRRSNLKCDHIPQSRLKDIVPSEHIKFIESLPFSYELEDFIFIHGGFNYLKPISETNQTTFAFDYISSQIFKRNWKTESQLDVEKVVIAVHNYNSKEPVIYPRYFMLGGTAPKKIIALDINSMESCAAKRGKSRIYKTKIKVYE